MEKKITFCAFKEYSCLNVYIYIYIYVLKEKERQKQNHPKRISLQSTC